MIITVLLFFTVLSVSICAWTKSKRAMCCSDAFDWGSVCRHTTNQRSLTSCWPICDIAYTPLTREL